MSKLYFYTDIEYIANDDEDIIVSIQFPSAATSGFTDIKLPSDMHIPINNDGEATIGKAGILRNKQILINSRPFNYANEVEDVKVNILVNSDIKIKHTNLKEVEPTPSIFLILTIK